MKTRFPKDYNRFVRVVSDLIPLEMGTRLSDESSHPILWGDVVRQLYQYRIIGHCLSDYPVTKQSSARSLWIAERLREIGEYWGVNVSEIVNALRERVASDEKIVTVAGKYLRAIAVINTYDYAGRFGDERFGEEWADYCRERAKREGYEIREVWTSWDNGCDRDEEYNITDDWFEDFDRLYCKKYGI